MNSSILRLFLRALFLLGGGLAATAVPPPVVFTDDLPSAGPLVSPDGTVALSWTVPKPRWTVELQHGATPAFADPVTRYHGADGGSVLTGLPEGTHFFRIRSTDTELGGAMGPWSPALEARVVFMDPGQLLLLLTLGAIVVLLTAGAILVGHVRARANATARPAAS